MIQKIYYLIYYKTRDQNLKKQSAFNALLEISFLEYLNLASLFVVINSFINFKIPKDQASLISIFIFGLIVLFNYIFLYLRIETISDKYDSIAEDKKKKFKLLIRIAAICSLVLFFYLLKSFL